MFDSDEYWQSGLMVYAGGKQVQSDESSCSHGCEKEDQAQFQYFYLCGLCHRPLIIGEDCRCGGAVLTRSNEIKNENKELEEWKNGVAIGSITGLVAAFAGIGIAKFLIYIFQ